MKRVDFKAGRSGVPFYGYIHEDSVTLSSDFTERPAVIVLPGGGYTLLSPREEDPVVFTLFAAGYQVFVLRYSVGDKIASPSYPEEEIADGVSILRANAKELMTMENGIFTLGFSAGGHAAASEACHWEKFGKGNINVFWNWSLASSPLSAAEATILNRADVQHAGKIKTILCSSKYKGLNATQKRLTLEKHFGDLLGKVDSVLPYIKRNNPTDNAKKVYEKRKCKNES